MPCTPSNLCKQGYKYFAEYFIVEAQQCSLDYVAMQNIDFSFLETCCADIGTQNVEDSFLIAQPAL